MPFARIEMEGADPEDGETLIIQVCLKSDGTPDKRFAYAGWRGRPKTDHWCWPIVFSITGKVDHGGGEDEDPRTRYSYMMIYDRPFMVGGIYEMFHNDGSLITKFMVKDVKLE